MRCLSLLLTTTFEPALDVEWQGFFDYLAGVWVWPVGVALALFGVVISVRLLVVLVRSLSW